MKLTILSSWILLSISGILVGAAPLILAPDVADYRNFKESNLYPAILHSSPELIAKTVADDKASIVGLIDAVHLLSYALIFISGLNGALIYCQFFSSKKASMKINA